VLLLPLLLQLLLPCNDVPHQLSYGGVGGVGREEKRLLRVSGGCGQEEDGGVALVFDDLKHIRVFSNVSGRCADPAADGRGAFAPERVGTKAAGSSLTILGDVQTRVQKRYEKLLRFGVVI
jgi:hypothetical protein